MNVNPFAGRYFLLIFLFIHFIFQPRAVSRTYVIGAREAALSGAVVSIPGVWSVFYNPAGLAMIHRLHTGVYHESVFMLKELSVSAGSAVFPAINGNMGLGLLQSGHRSFRENRIILAYGTRISAKITAGLQFCGIAGTIPEDPGYAGYATFGTGFIFTPSSGISFGAYLFNPVAAGSERMIKSLDDPFSISVGGYYPFSRDVMLTWEAGLQKELPVTGKTGIEISPAENVTLRCGLALLPVSFSFGTGYSHRDMTLDIAFSYHEYLGITPSLSLQFVP